MNKCSFDLGFYLTVGHSLSHVTDSCAHQSVVRVNPTVGGALGGAVRRVSSAQHAAVVALLAHTGTTAAPRISTVSI